MTMIASQITSLAVVYSTVYLDADQRKHQAPRHWPLCGEFTRTGEFPAQRPVTRKMFPFDDVIMHLEAPQFIMHEVLEHTFKKSFERTSPGVNKQNVFENDTFQSK